ncbi:hypothetical protein FHU13_001301 [Methylobacterium sp. R2-1]|nr:hypothetical protein [Methylobacterium sp. R2-1]
MLWSRFDMILLTSGPRRAVSSRAGRRRREPAGEFDNCGCLANAQPIMPFIATLNRGLLRAGNLIAGK